MRLTRWIGPFAIVLAWFVGLTGVSAAAPLPQLPSSQICVLAFEDQDRNGVRGPDEALLAGVGFTLSDASGVKGSYSTDGSSEPYCFGKLEPGSYNVRARPPQGFESTAEGQWGISLASGAQYDVKYGARRTGQSPAPGDTTGGSSTPSSSSGPSTLARIALGGLGVIILLAAGFMAGTIVQRSRQ